MHDSVQQFWQATAQQSSGHQCINMLAAALKASSAAIRMNSIRMERSSFRSLCLSVVGKYRQLQQPG
jgi:hypothetical protein